MSLDVFDLTHHLHGHVTIQNMVTGNILLEEKNVIVLGSSHLFSRMILTLGHPTDTPVGFGVWGLALGSGLDTWGEDVTPPNTVEALVDPDHLRVPLAGRQYMSQATPTSRFTPSPTWTPYVEMLTLLNTTSQPSLRGKPIREMGLIGGGTPTTDFLTAPFWSQNNKVVDSVSLINYKIQNPIIFPPGITFGVKWILGF